MADIYRGIGVVGRYLPLYHPSRGSISHTVWTIKPITKIRVTHLPQPTSSTTRPNPRNPRNPRNPLPEEKKNVQKPQHNVANSLHSSSLHLAPSPSQHLSLSAACPEANSQHLLPYCLQAVFRSIQSSATPIKDPLSTTAAAR